MNAKKTRLTCSECGMEAEVVDGRLVRGCLHNAPVLADLSAVVYGQASVASGNKEALKLQGEGR